MQKYIFPFKPPNFLSFFNLNIQFSGIYGKNNPLQDFLSGFLQGIVRKELYKILFICFLLDSSMCRHNSLDSTICIEFQLVDANLTVNTWLEMDIILVDAMIDNIPLICAWLLDY